MKTCTKCLQKKPEEEFYFFNKKKEQRINRCKECHKNASYEWQKKNPDSLKRSWTKFNRQRCKGRICDYCGENFKISSAQKGCSLRCRFYLSFIKNPNGCWDWIKAKGGRKGHEYGHIWVNGSHKIASRISYELHRGKIPEGLLVCHTCDRPCCVNPKHLFLGTNQDNADDAKRKGRGNIGRLHFRKYPREKALEVLSLRQEGKTFLEISVTTGVKKSSCKYICANPDRLKEV